VEWVRNSYAWGSITIPLTDSYLSDQTFYEFRAQYQAFGVLLLFWVSLKIIFTNLTVRIRVLYSGLEVAIAVASALAYLHSKRVVHLDVKSSNILLKHSVESVSEHFQSKKQQCEGSSIDGQDVFKHTSIVSLSSSVSISFGAKLSDVGLAKIVPQGTHEYIASTGELSSVWDPL
jgi:serine/threonine protein kinase